MFEFFLKNQVFPFIVFDLIYFVSNWFMYIFNAYFFEMLTSRWHFLFEM